MGNSPGQELRLGSMGRPLPGYAVALLDPLTGQPAEEGEICLDLSHRPLGLMTGYRDDPERDAAAMRGGYYHTGDVASRDADGYLTYVGRTDDVFKASDYRISPFELESVLIEHEAVAEAAVVPSPDPMRLAVPKAYVTLAAGPSRRRRPRWRSWPTPGSGWPRTSGSGGWSSASCPRRSPARSAGSSCVARRPTGSARPARPATGRPGPGGPRGTLEFWEEDFPELKGCGGGSEGNARTCSPAGSTSRSARPASARRSGRQLLARHGLRPGFAHTSVQRRAIRTAELALAECDRDWIPVRRSWRLNSNHYGALQGRNKAEVRAEVGAQQLARWRRSYDTAPPPLPDDAEHSSSPTRGTRPSRPRNGRAPNRCGT